MWQRVLAVGGGDNGAIGVFTAAAFGCLAAAADQNGRTNGVNNRHFNLWGKLWTQDSQRYTAARRSPTNLRFGRRSDESASMRKNTDTMS